ncbi:thioredoxin family protein [Rugamonas sp.]|uniref:thioredoxin family protein n=1 Tax=Rugamonas sp. TaxID=1926287 RepID=UPI0025D64CA5|nr:thioredoxin family protein [Rugamonas sp.]
MKLSKLFVTLALASLASISMAGEIKPYDQAAFDQLAIAGKPVVLSIYATWCTTCKAQKPIEDELMHAPAYRDLTMMTIDFDAAKPLLAKYHVAMQSTLIAFKAGKEVGRSVGDTTHAGIAALFKKTLN